MPIPRLDRTEIIQLIKSGKSAREASQLTGISIGVVYKAMHEFGITVTCEKKTRKIKYDEDSAIFQVLSGKSVKRVASEFCVPRSSIVKAMKSRGLRQPNRSEGMFRRMAETSREERSRLASFANEAARGRKATLQEREKAAKTVSERLSNQSPLEIEFAKMLDAIGVKSIPQCQIGPYNSDLACGDVAVEVWGGNWHFYGRHAERTPKRFRYMHNNGWHVVAVVHNKHHPISERASEYVRNFINWSAQNPNAARRHIVIYGDGIIVNHGCENDDCVSFKPIPSRLHARRRNDSGDVRVAS